MTKAVTTPPRRRWFQFSLAALFLMITVLGAVLSWNVNIVHKRRSERQWAREHGSYIGFSNRVEHPLDAQGNDVNGPYRFDIGGHPTIPRLRRWLSDESVTFIQLEAGNENRLDELKKIFPESDIWVAPEW